MERKMRNLPGTSRPYVRTLPDLPRTVVVTGKRGVGKTTFLLSRIQKKHLLYISVDNPLIAAIPLYTLVEELFLQGYEGVILDEIHFAKDWSRHVKSLYDDFPNHIIWLSDSSSLVLHDGAADLSRRYLKLKLPLLSFREYIALTTNELLPSFNPFEENIPIQAESRLLRAFSMYRGEGTRPFFQEGFYPERMLEVLDKTLYSDIPFFLPNLSDNHIRIMRAVVSTLAQNPIPRLKVRKLCSDWNISSEKLYQLLSVMESTGLIRIIQVVNDHKAHTVGAKMFLGDPSFYPMLQGQIGTAREALFAACIEESGMTLEASKDETMGDFLIAHALSVEVGGKKKVRKQSDLVVRDDTDVAYGSVLPLWSLGFLY